MIQFYAPDIKVNFTLPEDESVHCSRVLRMKENDTIYIVDGKGYRYTCTIVEAHPKHTAVEIVSEEYLPNIWDNNLTLAVAPTKNIDRIEWLIEKAVEMGVNKIVLIKCEHSERKNINLERLDRIVVSAMKQSLKAVKPELVGLVGFRDFVSSDCVGQKYMGYCDENTDRTSFVKTMKPGSDVTILIGPEGDFSPAEVEFAVKSGFLPVTFGDNRLRTETAALYAITAFHVLEDLRK